MLLALRARRGASASRAAPLPATRRTKSLEAPRQPGCAGCSSMSAAPTPVCRTVGTKKTAMRADGIIQCLEEGGGGEGSACVCAWVDGKVRIQRCMLPAIARGGGGRLGGSSGSRSGQALSSGGQTCYLSQEGMNRRVVAYAPVSPVVSWVAHHAAGQDYESKRQPRGQRPARVADGMAPLGGSDDELRDCCHNGDCLVQQQHRRRAALGARSCAGGRQA